MTTLFAAAIILIVLTVIVIGALAVQGSTNHYVGFANSTITNIRNGRMPGDDVVLLRDSIKRQKEDYDAEQAKNARMKGE